MKKQSTSHLVYTKPYILPLTHSKIGWARSANISKMVPKVAFADFIGQRTVISKSIYIEAKASKVWEIVGNPSNTPAFTPGLISMEKLSGSRYMATVMIPPTEGDEWKTESIEEEIVLSKDEKLIQYRLLHPEAEVDYYFELEDSKDGTILTGRFEINNKITNHEEMEHDLENILLQIAKLSMSPDDLINKIKKFEGR